jgi:3-hydroxyacyl-[acyl-carrier-protein] dehydratase
MTTTFLLNDFYSIQSSQLSEGDKFISEIILNKKHPIFNGHFEQMPVVPGVCQTQIIMELLQLHLKKSLMLQKGDNIKFLAMIIPTQIDKITVEISFKIESESISVDAKLWAETITFTKFKGTFIII